MTVLTSVYNQAVCGHEVPLAPDDGGNAAESVECVCGRRHIVASCPVTGQQMVPRAINRDDVADTLTWWCPFCNEAHTSQFDWAEWDAYEELNPPEMN